MKTALKNLIVESLKNCYSQAGEFNLMLSGGVDSSTLLALAIKNKIPVNKIYTVALPYGTAHDELNDTLKVVKALGVEDKLTIIHLDEASIKKDLMMGVSIIGRPIPHYNIFPLYQAFKKMREDGITSIFVGDGPDESMCGYTRHLIMYKLYEIYSLDAYLEYHPTIDKILPFDEVTAYSRVIGKSLEEVEPLMRGKTLVNGMCATDMDLMRKDMVDMSHSLADSFGIKIYAPYEEKEVDEYMYNLPEYLKIAGNLGKVLLRDIAYKAGVPKEISYREHKIGGPVVPINTLMGWDLEPFDKSRYLSWQKEVLELVP